ncbi:hypothetical protein ABAC460_15085 [Asticcacaulis sp. AC460]|uniref:DUF3237 domain-containing protein n=1 Tax=Asticcacaulis sp. AC460 TaxID=1282360 RepID=UPI0003C3CF40|nr:DUF3237 domain-containing protein [Asticcacaulis sp. AC460]ESQ88614.1 hypothetical protein ABAC460_15085 [Asticcacaulis sp. AC460]
MSDSILSRRTLLGASAGVAAALTAAARPASASGLVDLDPIKTELVMNLVVTCSTPQPMGPNAEAKDGRRDVIWPIIGGRFEGPKLKGKVVPGGADFPVTRPDGVDVVDAFYRLQADDGTLIIIHNVGLMYPQADDGRYVFRLSPSFTTVKGPHDWLQKSLFLATLVYGDAVPEPMRLAKGPDENDRLIQVHRVF